MGFERFVYAVQNIYNREKQRHTCCKFKKVLVKDIVLTRREYSTLASGKRSNVVGQGIVRPLKTARAPGRFRSGQPLQHLIIQELHNQASIAFSSVSQSL
jgi:hypothetical protein